MRYDGFPAAQFGNVCASGGFDGFYRTAAAHAIDQADMRQSQFRSQTFSLYAFTGDGCIAEPPRTVKSSPDKITGRSSMSRCRKQVGRVK